MNNQPTFTVYNVTSRKGKDDFWQKIGGGFEFTTKDGRYGIQIPALNLVLLEPKEDEKQ